MAWMIIRVRGTIHSKEDIRETLRQLHLTRPNHATVVPEAPEFKGMLSTVQGYVTWGEAEPETVKLLLEKRGKLREGGAGAASKGTAAPAPASFASAVLEQGLARQRNLQPLFRLRPPKGGWKSTKRPFARGGALGYRGIAINSLAQRMV